MIKAILKLFDPSVMWRSWLGHSLVALIIAAILDHLLGVAGNYAVTIAVSMYAGREVLSWAWELAVGKKNINHTDHFFDFFFPLIIVTTVWYYAGWL